MYIDHDIDNDVLYIRRDDVKICNSKECFQDCYVVLNYNSSNEIVGTIILGALSLIELWYRHPVRAMLPQDILASLDLWYSKQFD